jgi:hypothetical protein
VLDTPPNPADAGGVQTLRTIPDAYDLDAPTESGDRPVPHAVERLIALARAVDSLLSAGMSDEARPLVRRLIELLASIGASREPGITTLGGADDEHNEATSASDRER